MNNFSTTGYKDDSPDKNNTHNLIPGRNITMQGVSKSLTLIPIVNGKPQYDRKRVAKPGDPDIEFEEDVEGVLELPYAQMGTMTNPYLENYLNANPGTQVVPSGVPNIPPMVNVRPPSVEEYGNQQINQQLADGVAPQGPSPYNPSLYSTQSSMSALSSGVDPNEAQQIQAEAVTEDQKKKPFMGAINPYGGWNMQNASTALGAFIEDKNPLGIIGSAGKILLEGTRNAMSGAAALKTYREGKNEYETELEEQERRQGMFWAQKGGMTNSKMLTGNYIEGNDNHSNPNTEVEKGEYLQTPDGSTMEVLGDKHSTGGELLNLPGGTKVVSDYLKIGAKLATFFKKEFDLNVKSTSTFASVLDKYKKKIGLTELLEDETKLMTKLEKQEDVEFEGTREINSQVLSEKINDLQAEKREMENKFEMFTNIVFDKQEETKEPGQKNFEKQEGGVIDQQTIDEQGNPIPQEGQPQEGGGSELEQLIMAFAQITGQDPAQIIEQLQQLPEDQLQQAVEQMIQVIQQGQQPQGQQPQGQEQMAPEQPMMRKGGEIQFAQKGMTVEEFDNLMANYKWDSDYNYGDIKAQSQRLKPILDRLGIEYTDKDLSTQQGQDKLAGLAQQSFRQKYGKTSDHYSSKVAATQTGLQTALDNKLVTETELKNLGVKVADGKVLRGSKGIVPTGNETKVVDLITKNGESNPEGYKKYVDTNFVDNKWFYRFADVKDVNFNDEAQKQQYIKDKNFTPTGDPNIYYSQTEGLYFNPIVGTTGETPNEVKETPEGDKVDASAGIKPLESNVKNWDTGMPLLVPNQDSIAPNLLQPGLRTVGHVQANAIRISPEETIRELNRQYSTASNLAAETNPYTSGAMQADLQAKTNSAINQAYSQAAIVNAQDERNVQNINEERIQNRDITNIGAMNNYEMLSQKALDNFGQSWRNFYDKKNIENVNNYNLQQQVNASNAINDNYKIGSMGEIYQTGEAPMIYFTGMNGQPMAYNSKTKETYELSKTNSDGSKEKTKKEVSNKKKGGLLLKGSNFKKYFK